LTINSFCARQEKYQVVFSLPIFFEAGQTRSNQEVAFDRLRRRSDGGVDVDVLKMKIHDASRAIINTIKTVTAMM